MTFIQKIRNNKDLHKAIAATLFILAVVGLGLFHSLTWLMLTFVWGLYSITYNKLTGNKCVRCYTNINTKDYHEE